MKISSKNAPPGAYCIEPHVGHPGEVCVRLFENARQVTVETHWEYDEYQIIAPYTDRLQADIESNYADWIDTAKMGEAGIGKIGNSEYSPADKLNIG